MTKIKVKRHVLQNGKELFQNQNPTQFGPDAKNLYSAQEVAASPDKFEVVEAWQPGYHNGSADCLCRECVTKLRTAGNAIQESAPLSPGWVRVKEVRGVKARPRLHEDDAQSQSFRQRLAEAFECLGHSPVEAAIASRTSESTLLDAWTIVMGGNREAAIHARGQMKSR